jgi:hypothetical protein
MPVSSPADVLKVLKIIGILQYNDGDGAVVGVGYALYDTDCLRAQWRTERGVWGVQTLPEIPKF